MSKFQEISSTNHTTLIELRNGIHMFQTKSFIFLLPMAEVLGEIVCVLLVFVRLALIFHL